MFGGGGFGGFADLYEQRARQRGPDLQAQLRITLREAAMGVKKSIHIPTRNISGARDSRKIEVDIPAGMLQEEWDKVCQLCIQVELFKGDTTLCWIANQTSCPASTFVSLYQ